MTSTYVGPRDPLLTRPSRTTGSMAEWTSWVDTLTRRDRDKLYPGMHIDLIPAYEVIMGKEESSSQSAPQSAFSSDNGFAHPRSALQPTPVSDQVSDQTPGQVPGLAATNAFDTAAAFTAYDPARYIPQPWVPPSPGRTAFGGASGNPGASLPAPSASPWPETSPGMMSGLPPSVTNLTPPPVQPSSPSPWGGANSSPMAPSPVSFNPQSPGPRQLDPRQLDPMAANPFLAALIKSPFGQPPSSTTQQEHYRRAGLPGLGPRLDSGIGPDNRSGGGGILDSLGDLINRARGPRKKSKAEETLEHYAGATAQAINAAQNITDTALRIAYEEVVQVFIDFWTYYDTASEEERNEVHGELAFIGIQMIPGMGQVVSIASGVNSLHQNSNQPIGHPNSRQAKDSIIDIILILIPAIGAAGAAFKFWRRFKRI